MRMLLYSAACLLLAACATTGTTPTPEALAPKYNPDKASMLKVNLGIEYMRRGRYEDALHHLQRALELDSRNPEAHNAMAILYERLKEPENAGSHYAKAVELEPGNAGAQNNYAAYLCRHGKAAQAEEHFLKAINNPLYQTPELAETNAGICFAKQRDFAKAKKYLRQALQKSKDYPVALYHMANLHYEDGRYGEAWEYFRRYTDVAGHTPQSLWLGVKISKQTGDKNKAASYALLLRSKFPDSEQAALLKSEAW